MKIRGKAVFRRIGRYLRDAVDWLIDWLQYFAQSVYRKSKKRAREMWRDITAIRWHNVKREAKAKFFSSYDYFRNTTPKQVAIDVYEWFMTAFERLQRYFTANWRRRVFITVVIVAYASYLIFSHLIASPQRVKAVYQSNYENSVVLVDEITELYRLFDQPPPEGELVISVATQAASPIVDEIEELDFTDPHRWILQFAVREFVSGSEEALRADDVDGDGTVAEIIDNLNLQAEISRPLIDVLEIEEPQNDVNQFQANLRLLEEKLAATQSTSLDTPRLLRITRLLISETDEYIFLDDKQRFIANTADFKEELRKSAESSWLELRTELLSKASALKFDYERFNSYLFNNLPEN